MKILIVSQYFWPENFRINDLAQGLVERGHKITVLTGLPNYPSGKFFSGYGFFKQPRESFDGVKIIRAPLIPRGRGGAIRLSLNYLSFALFASLVALFRFRKKYDLIFVFEPSPFTVGLPAIVLRSLKKIPLMFWVQDLWPESLTATGSVRSPLILECVGKMVRSIYKRCDRVLVQSEGFIDPAVRAGAEPKRICFFPNWSEDIYQPAKANGELPPPVEFPQGFCLMFAGNLGEAQSLETLLGAAERLRDTQDIQWVIVGDGRRREWMQNEAHRLHLENRIHFLGKHPVESMPQFFSHSDALLATLKPDPVFSLTIPSKVQSYLACAKPVLAALDGEGARIIKDSGGGIAVPAGDAAGLAEAALKLYRMREEERVAIGQQGRQYYEEHFNRSKLLGQLETWMQEMVEEGI